MTLMNEAFELIKYNHYIHKATKIKGLQENSLQFQYNK